jgi:hypothetical protein
MSETQEDTPKLGPNVTYTPEDENDKNPVTYAGIQMLPGKAVNFEERMGKKEAASHLASLAGNRFFKVDGGPDWKQQAEQKAQAEEQDAKDLQASQQQQDEERQKREGSYKGPEGELNTLKPPPDDWEGPDEMKLESDSGARRPSTSKSSRKGD